MKYIAYMYFWLFISLLTVQLFGQGLSLLINNTFSGITAVFCTGFGALLGIVFAFIIHEIAYKKGWE